MMTRRRGSTSSLALWVTTLWVTACSSKPPPKPEVDAIPTPVSSEPTAQHASAQPAQLAFDVPALRGRVNDYADILTPVQEAELSGLYESLERETGAQMALLAVPSSSGVPIEKYSLTVANAWGLGRRGIDDGLLITVAFNDRTLRIEVGSGLESIISDQAAADVVRRMIAKFAAGSAFEGIRTGSLELIRMIRANPAPVRGGRP